MAATARPPTVGGRPLNYALDRLMASFVGLEEKRLRRAVSEVLHYSWDPIGVAGVVAARDEYDGYVDGICSMLWSGAAEAEIAQELMRIVREEMGIDGSEPATAATAAKLLAWKAEITR